MPEHTEGPEKVLHRDLLLPCGFLSSTDKGMPIQRSKARKQPDNSPRLEPDRTEEDEELSDIEGEVEYYSLDDQFPTETLAAQADPEQDGRILQEERPQTGSCTDKGTHMENDSATGRQEVSVSLDVFNLNPEALPFEPIYVGGDEGTEADPVHCPRAPSAVRVRESPSSVPIAELSEHSSSESGIDNVSEMLEGCVDVQEQKGPDNAEDAIDDGVPLRRSGRDKTAPNRLTFPTLRNPLITVIHSILVGLDQAFSETLDNVPYVSRITPLTSEIV